MITRKLMSLFLTILVLYLIATTAASIGESLHASGSGLLSDIAGDVRRLVASTVNAMRQGDSNSGGNSSSSTSSGASNTEITLEITRLLTAHSSAVQIESFVARKAAIEAVENYLRRRGIQAEVVTITFYGGEYDYVHSRSRNWIISAEGRHVGIMVALTDGAAVYRRVFCLVHPYGLPLSPWLNDFVSYAGVAVVTPLKYQVYRSPCALLLRR